MKLVPRDTVLDFDDIVEQFFNTGRTQGESRSGFFSPRVDIHERKGNYEISAEMPGIAKEDLEVTLENGVLTIEAEVRQNIEEGEGKEEDRRVLRQERRYGKFTRSFNLGEGIKEEDIDATFKDGVLTLTVPKAEPKAPVSHRIQIH